MTDPRLEAVARAVSEAGANNLFRDRDIEQLSEVIIVAYDAIRAFDATPTATPESEESNIAYSRGWSDGVRIERQRITDLIVLNLLTDQLIYAVDHGLTAEDYNETAPAETPFETDLCKGDGNPCYVNSGEDAHWRCGTAQCGKTPVGADPSWLDEAKIKVGGMLPNQQSWEIAAIVFCVKHIYDRFTAAQPPSEAEIAVAANNINFGVQARKSSFEIARSALIAAAKARAGG